MPALNLFNGIGRAGMRSRLVGEYNHAMTCLRSSWFESLGHRVAAMALVIALVALCSCADNRVAGGNSSGTSNTIVGRLVDSAGRGAEGVHVVARPLRWKSEEDGTRDGLLGHAVTDSTGRFAFPDLPPDVWVLEAGGSTTGYLFAPAVSGASASRTDVGTGVLGSLAPLVGRMRVPDFAGFSGGSIRLSGTTHVAAIDHSGRFRIESVPPGVGRLDGALRSAAGTWRAETTLTIGDQGQRETIHLEGTSGAAEDYSTWGGTRKCLIDLSSPSSYLSSDQHDVPILVRLDGSILPIWDLSGSSIRFSSERGRHLPYEIEEWNPVLRRARIWVRIDTLNERSAEHHFSLHWGKEGVPGRSDGAAVFDSSRGWLGAWHFVEGRTWQNATGRIPTFTRAPGAKGASISGEGILFDSAVRLVLDDPALATIGGVTALAFVRIDSILVDRVFLLRQGAEDSTSFDWALSLRDSSGSLSASFSTRLQPWSPTPPKTTGPIPRSTWTFVGGVFDTSARRSRLELPDGLNRWTTPYDTLRVRNPSPRLEVGGGMVARIDEIRLMGGPMHPDFIRAQWLSWDASSGMLRWLP